MRTTVTAILAVYVMFATAAHAQNLVVNGSFEQPAIASGTFQLFSSIPGWQLCGGPFIEIQNHIAGSPFDGQQFTELDSTASDAICQDITTIPGKTYHLSFAFSPRPGVVDNRFEVLWGGALVTQKDADGSALADTNWTVFTFDVVATGIVTTLEFNGLSVSDGLGPFIDAVQVAAAAPAPVLSNTMLGVMALLLVAIAARMLRRTPRSA